MMVEEFNFRWSEIQNYIAEADAGLIPVSGQLELHRRCRYGVLLSPCLWCSLFVADLIVGMEEFELHFRKREGAQKSMGNKNKVHGRLGSL